MDFLDVIREQMGEENAPEEPELFPDLVPIVEAWWALTAGTPPVSAVAALAYRREVPVLMETPVEEYMQFLRAADRSAKRFFETNVKQQAKAHGRHSNPSRNRR